MKKLNILTLLLFLLSPSTIFAQDEWEPQMHFTGYINTVAEYSDCQNLKKEYAIGLSEVGLLGSYKPLEKLEIKTTLVYTHFTFHVSQIFVEAYGIYNFADELKLGAGRFLTPLSPVNLYFYAPLNPSGVVPMLVSQHFLFPQSISGFQLAGVAELGTSFKLGYNGTLGTYPYINHFEAGILGILSQEDSYPTFGYYDTEADKINHYFCGTGRIYGKFFDKVTIGANYFGGDAQQVTQDATTGAFIYYPSTKYTYGFDFHLDIANVKLNAEYWTGKQETTAETDLALGQHIENEYSAYYGEIIYDGDIFKPFVRYDFIEDVNVNGAGLPTGAATIGIAVRPIYETLFKLEYKRIFAKELNFEPTGIISNDYEYSYAQFSLVISF